MVDLRNAKEALENYLDGYERENDKVKLKIIHTYGVVECSRKIAEGLKLSEEDCKLAQIIGLLHDIGRFEQLKSYDSFEPETMNHAAYGVKILFEEGTIRRFVKEDKWDGIIKMAIARHSDYSLQGITDERELLHAQIIRDADKLDNCRVKLENPIETMLGVPEEAVGMSEISREVMQQFENQTSVLLETRRTKMDYWLSYLAYFFDINFKVTYEIINDNHYVDKLIGRIPYINPKTRKEEIYLSYPNYDEYVSREFAEKEKVIKDREVASTRCPVCHLPAKRKIRWFMNNSRAYESVSFCQKHGYIKGKVRIRHTDEDAFYAIKTLKRIDEEKAEEIREKRDSLRKKRQTKRQSEKFV